MTFWAHREKVPRRDLTGVTAGPCIPLPDKQVPSPDPIDCLLVINHASHPSSSCSSSSRIHGWDEEFFTVTDIHNTNSGGEIWSVIATAWWLSRLHFQQADRDLHWSLFSPRDFLQRHRLTVDVDKTSTIAPPPVSTTIPCNKFGQPELNSPVILSVTTSNNSTSFLDISEWPCKTAPSSP